MADCTSRQVRNISLEVLDEAADLHEHRGGPGVPAGAHPPGNDPDELTVLSQRTAAVPGTSADGLVERPGAHVRGMQRFGGSEKIGQGGFALLVRQDWDLHVLED